MSSTSTDSIHAISASNPAKYFYLRNSDKVNRRLLKDFIKTEDIDNLEEALTHIPSVQVKRCLSPILYTASEKAYESLKCFLSFNYLPSKSCLCEMAGSSKVTLRTFKILKDDERIELNYQLLAKNAITYRGKNSN